MFRGFFNLLIGLSLTGCQLGYIAKSAYYQADILRRRIPIENAGSEFALNEKQKAQIQLAIKVRQFIKNDLGLNIESNYGTYVHLDRDYVTYAVSAAAKNKLEHHRWHFPIVGSVPYKGYFVPADAKKEAKRLEAEGLDVYVRGVSAYSTLGWFSDPLLSSMLRYSPQQLVNTLIHETVHANLYIKDASSFNERIASFLGLVGAEAFYKKNGEGEKMKRQMALEQKDDLIFSNFISREIASLRQWYLDNQDKPNIVELRKTQFNKLQERFKTDVLPRLSTKNYSRFAETKLNNARLLLYDLYMTDFSDLEKIAQSQNRNFRKIFAYLKTLEDEENPVEKLKKDAAKL